MLCELIFGTVVSILALQSQILMYHDFILASSLGVVRTHFSVEVMVTVLGRWWVWSWW